MQTPKKIRGRINPAGIAERAAFLIGLGLPAELFDAGPPRGAAMDGFGDAAVNLALAARHRAGATRPWPAMLRRGLPIAIYR